MDFNVKNYINCFPADSEKLWNLNAKEDSEKWQLCELSQANTIKSELEQLFN